MHSPVIQVVRFNRMKNKISILSVVVIAVITIAIMGNRPTEEMAPETQAYTSIDDEGVLILEDNSGVSHRITTGDVHIMKTPSDEGGSATDV